MSVSYLWSERQHHLTSNDIDTITNDANNTPDRTGRSFCLTSWLSGFGIGEMCLVWILPVAFGTTPGIILIAGMIALINTPSYITDHINLDRETGTFAIWWSGAKIGGAIISITLVYTGVATNLLAGLFAILAIAIHIGIPILLLLIPITLIPRMIFSEVL